MPTVRNRYGSILITGTLIQVNFNKNKEQGVKRVEMGDKVLFEGTV